MSVRVWRSRVLTLWLWKWTLNSSISFIWNVNILQIKKANFMKYTTFCRGINGDYLATLKNIYWNINNIDNQLDATIKASTMLSDGGRQHRGCIIPQDVTHIVVLLLMGKIIAPNMLSWLEFLISRYFCM